MDTHLEISNIPRVAHLQLIIKIQLERLLLR
jgi:hypothetical protein